VKTESNLAVAPFAAKNRDGHRDGEKQVRDGEASFAETEPSFG